MIISLKQFHFIMLKKKTDKDPRFYIITNNNTNPSDTILMTLY